MNILITGANGFIGRHLVQKLLKEGKFKLFCLVRSSKKGEKLRKLGAELIIADIKDEASLQGLRGLNIDIAFHCAAKIRGRSLSSLYDTNIKGTSNVFKLCYGLKIKKIVYLSTVAVVTGNDKVPFFEDMPFKANSAYGVSKIEAEKIALQYRAKGMKVAILRPPIVYGPDEPHLTKLLIFLLKHRLILVPENGKYKMHMVYVENLVEAMLKAIYEDSFLEGAFFVADKEVLSIKEILAVMTQALGSREPFSMPVWLSALLSRVPFVGEKIRYLKKDMVFSIQKLLQTGFKHPYSLKESLVFSFSNFDKSAKEPK
ncbi:MAG: NAD-dependent epimerase/dehydratase family protein [Candidatus Omnitrophica bacterium]|nr:NAD-dependent epimerase/dehydratase family protein [Candidatus Omnitrophota bacterium]